MSVLKSEWKQRLYLLVLIGDFLLNVIRRIRKELSKAMVMFHLNHKQTHSLGPVSVGNMFSFPFQPGTRPKGWVESQEAPVPALTQLVALGRALALSGPLALSSVKQS